MSETSSEDNDSKPNLTHSNVRNINNVRNTQYLMCQGLRARALARNFARLSWYDIIMKKPSEVLDNIKTSVDKFLLCL